MKHLTLREQAVVLLVVQGWSNRQISIALAFSAIEEFESILLGIYEQLGVADRLELLALMLPQLVSERIAERKKG